MRIFLMFFVSMALCACEAIEKEETPDGQQKSSSNFVVNTLPQGQESPIENPNKIGVPATFLLLVNSSNLTYKFHETATLLPLDVSGQWVNTDRDVTVSILTQNVQAYLEPTRSDASQFTIPKGTPSFQLSLKSESVGPASFSISSEDPLLNLFAEFDIVVGKPTKATATTPVLNTCSPFQINFTDADGRPAFFSTEQSEELEISPAGCSIYSDATCTTQVSAISVQSDQSQVTDIWVNSGSSSAFIDVVSESFSGRISCAGF
jgi:hypothetical protein